MMKDKLAKKGKINFKTVENFIPMKLNEED